MATQGAGGGPDQAFDQVLADLERAAGELRTGAGTDAAAMSSGHAGPAADVGVAPDPDEDIDKLLAGDDPVAVFAAEAAELIQALAAQLRDWRAGGPDAEGLALARQRLHTLKGSARMAGLAPAGELAHALESLLAGAEAMPAAVVSALLGCVQHTLHTLADEITTAAGGGALQRDEPQSPGQRARIAAECSREDSPKARMLPFGRVQARLARVVCSTADALGKRVQLTLCGAHVMLDGRVLKRFMPPLEHLLRNAVVHGIEPPAARAAAGKPEQGAVRVTLSRKDHDLVFDIADDGAGIDQAKVRQRAVTMGLMAAHARPPEREVLALTLHPGLSTAEAVTQDAGRGIGLDAVSTQVAALNGALLLASQPGRGTLVRVRLPLGPAAMASEPG